MKRSPLRSVSPRSGFRWQGNKRAESCVYDGRTFHSRKEAGYAAQLDLLKKAGEVASWKGQVNVPLVVNGAKVCTMIVDFLVTFADGREEYHEVKGWKTDVWNIKAKLLKALHPECVYRVIE